MDTTDTSRVMDEVIFEKVFGRRKGSMEVPDYSTGMYGAGLVMANMVSRGLSWKMSKGTLDGKEFNSAELSGPGGVFEMGSAGTIELAICLAALKVVDRMELY